MLTKVDVTNRRGNTLSLSMQQNDSGYQVDKIFGLDPVPAILTSTAYSGSDGELFQSARRGPRNIRIRLDLEPDFETNTYTSLRRNLYSYFMTKARVSMRYYMTSGLYVDISGIVEEMSSPQFEEDPNVEISIMCHKPDFIDPRIFTLAGTTVSDGTTTTINYPGDVEAGTVLVLNINRAVEDFSIYNMDESGVLQQLDFSGELMSGDQLVISSLQGSKGITLTRASVSSSYLHGRSAQSSWIQLFEGPNDFRVYAVGDPIPYELEYAVRYGGL